MKHLFRQILLLIIGLALGAHADTNDYTLKRWSTLDGLPQNFVSGVTQTEDGFLWISTFDGLSRFDGQRFVNYNPSTGYSILSNRLTAIASTGNEIVVGDYRGEVAVFFEGEVEVVLPASNYGDLVQRFEQTSDGLRVTRMVSGDIVLDDPRFANTVTEKTMEADTVELEIRQPSGVIDQRGRQWLRGREQGVFVIDNDGLFARFSAENKLLPTNAVESLAIDRDGNIWVGTSRGLLRIREKTFQTYSVIEGETIGGLVTTVTETGTGDILVGSRGGGLFRVEGGHLVPHRFQGRAVTALLNDSTDRLWIGFMDGSLVRTRSDFSQLQQLNLPNERPDKRIYAIFESVDGRVFVGTTNGLHLIDSDDQISRDTTIGERAVRAIAQNAAGELWFAAQGGQLFKRMGNSYEVISAESGLKIPPVWELHFDPEGVLWTGSFGRGVNRIDGLNMTGLTMKDGLWSNLVGSILSDDAGRVWFGSGRGIFYLNREELQHYVAGAIPQYRNIAFGVEDGIEDEESSGGYQTSAIRDSNGDLWFAAISGVVRLYSKRVVERARVPETSIEAVIRDNVEIVPQGDRYIIPPGTLHTTFSFTSPSLTAPQKTSFRYRLVGYDLNWLDAGLQRRAEYSLIPPGNYQFEVVASAEDGLWSPNPARIRVTVEPFFWQTLWFQTLMLLSVVVSTAAVVRYFYVLRLRRQQEAALQREMIHRERQRIAQDLHDDVGARLTHLGMMLESDTGVDDLRDKTQQLAFAMDEVVWSVNPNNDNLEDLADYICSYAEEFLAPSNIQCRFELDIPANRIDLGVRERHELFACYKEALSNLAKHSGAEMVQINVSANQHEMSVTVSDNGKGFDLDNELSVTNSGVSNMRDRVAALGGKFGIESSPQGTIVRFTVPM